MITLRMVIVLLLFCNTTNAAVLVINQVAFELMFPLFARWQHLSVALLFHMIAHVSKMTLGSLKTFWIKCYFVFYVSRVMFGNNVRWWTCKRLHIYIVISNNTNSQVVLRTLWHRHRKDEMNNPVFRVGDLALQYFVDVLLRVIRAEIALHCGKSLEILFFFTYDR